MSQQGINPDGSSRSRLDQLPRVVHGTIPPQCCASTENTAGCRLNGFFSLWLQGFPKTWGLSGVQAMRSVSPSRRNSSAAAKKLSSPILINPDTRKRTMIDILKSWASVPDSLIRIAASLELLCQKANVTQTGSDSADEIPAPAKRGRPAKTTAETPAASEPAPSPAPAAAAPAAPKHEVSRELIADTAKSKLLPFGNKLFAGLITKLGYENLTKAPESAYPAIYDALLAEIKKHEDAAEAAKNSSGLE